MDIEIFLFFFVPFLFTYALMIGLGFLEIQILKYTFKVKDFILVILLKILATLYFTVLIFYFCFKKVTARIFLIYILLFFVDLFFMYLILEIGELIIMMPAF